MKPEGAQSTAGRSRYIQDFQAGRVGKTVRKSSAVSRLLALGSWNGKFFAGTGQNFLFGGPSELNVFIDVFEVRSGLKKSRSKS
jgi:hypothetical protein